MLFAGSVFCGSGFLEFSFIFKGKREAGRTRWTGTLTLIFFMQLGSKISNGDSTILQTTRLHLVSANNYASTLESCELHRVFYFETHSQTLSQNTARDKAKPSICTAGGAERCRQRVKARQPRWKDSCSATPRIYLRPPMVLV